MITEITTDETPGGIAQMVFSTNGNLMNLIDTDGKIVEHSKANLIQALRVLQAQFLHESYAIMRKLEAAS